MKIVNFIQMSEEALRRALATLNLPTNEDIYELSRERWGMVIEYHDDDQNRPKSARIVYWDQNLLDYTSRSLRRPGPGPFGEADIARYTGWFVELIKEVQQRIESGESDVDREFRFKDNSLTV